MNRKITTFLFVALFLTIGVFAALKSVHDIDADLCTACGLCEETCPEGAISPGEVDGKEVFIIDPVLCTNCGECAESCPVEAIAETQIDL